jgi:hypothetical protein
MIVFALAWEGGVYRAGDVIYGGGGSGWMGNGWMVWGGRGGYGVTYLGINIGIILCILSGVLLKRVWCLVGLASLYLDNQGIQDMGEASFTPSPSWLSIPLRLAMPFR